jgi:hypothetical protein
LARIQSAADLLGAPHDHVVIEPVDLDDVTDRQVVHSTRLVHIQFSLLLAPFASRPIRLRQCGATAGVTSASGEHQAQDC